MKRYDIVGDYDNCSIQEFSAGDYCLYEDAQKEAQALLAEKDAEIAHLGDVIKFKYDQCKTLEEQLRASNEALVAAEARISGLIDGIKELASGDALAAYGQCLPKVALDTYDNLTALRQHDKELLEKVANDIESGWLDSYFDPEYARRIRCMADELD